MRSSQAASAPNQAGAVPVGDSFSDGVEDGQSEWEYEYSSVETETYYLTLELSYPEFKQPSTRAYRHSRGGYYKDRRAGDLSSSAGATKSTSGLHHEHAGGDDDEADDEERETDDEADNNANKDGKAGVTPRRHADRSSNSTPVDPALQGTSSKRKEEPIGLRTLEESKRRRSSMSSFSHTAANNQSAHRSAEAEHIQILELHSSNPVILYKSQLFQGQWAEVIGTEAIFTAREQAEPLKAVRSLPGDIDLLGASSSRILTTRKRLNLNV